MKKNNVKKKTTSDLTVKNNTLEIHKNLEITDDKNAFLDVTAAIDFSEIRNSSSNKKYYLYLDIIRVLSCIGVLLYHFDILKGGYLLVCTFFVLSGYLSTINALKKDKFSLLEYYKNRFIKIYIPLLITIFITVLVVLKLQETNWINLKPEVYSILLGYNNFWQLSANLDYFARHLDSPFMHFWYIGILIQLELVFPFILILLKKVKEKINLGFSIFIIAILGIISIGIFILFSYKNNIMGAYYNTFARAFSWLFGIMLGLIHANGNSMNIVKNDIFKKIIFYLYLLIQLVLCIFISSNNSYFYICMIISTFIAIRLIDYSSKLESKIVSKSIILFSCMSYIIYLVQYPIKYIFSLLEYNGNLRLPFSILLILIISYIINFSLNKSNKLKILRIMVRILLLGVSITGLYFFIIEKDYSTDMKELEEQLNQNKILMEQRQEAFEDNYNLEQEKLNQELANLEFDPDKLDEIIKNLHVVGIGDSVMLGAVPNLYSEFKLGYFDAAISRTAWVINGILVDLKNSNKLGNPIVIGLGANGDCPETCKDQIMKTIGKRDVYWINVTNDKQVHFNKKLVNFAKKYDNLHIIDWNSISKEHSEYFVSDGIHLTNDGRKAYVNAIYDAIYNKYLNEYNKQKDEIVKKHEEELKNKITFYGDELLLNAFDKLEKDFSNDKFSINDNLKFTSLKENIENDISNNTLTNKLVFISNDIKKDEYKEIIDMCYDRKIYIVAINEDLNDLNNENVMIIDFYKEKIKNDNYVMYDKVHLTKDGNEMLVKIIKDTLK